MNIVAHIPDEPAGALYLICFTEMAKQYPNDVFYLMGRPSQVELPLPENCQLIPVSFETKKRYPRFKFYQFTLPSLLKKLQADYFFSPGLYCSLTTNVRQSLCLHLQHSSERIQRTGLSKKYIRKVESIACTSQTMYDKMVVRYPEVEKKAMVVGRGLHPMFTPVSFSEALNIKEQFTHGKEYFLCVVNDANKHLLMNILKAYTIFKKWQQSSIEILLILQTENPEVPLNDFASYKHRAHIQVLHRPDIKTESKIVAAAFGMLVPDISFDLMEDVLHAMQCNVPVIWTGKDMPVPGSAFFKSGISEKEIAEKMMILYRDEHLTAQTKIAAAQYCESYSWKSLQEHLYSIVKKGTVETT
jgi:hypothetical protein